VLVEVGDPAEAIVRVARELRSDVIVMAWSGSIDPDRARTAKAVLRSAPCPVMFLRTSPESVLDGGLATGASSP
jgi:nucleotide-binding universal stress UspA family protein